LWFLVCPNTERRPSWSQPISEQLPEFSTLVVREGVPTPTPEHRKVLENEALPLFLAKRRWFASKHLQIHAVRIVYTQPLPRYAPNLQQVIFAEVDVEVGDGRSRHAERYFLPVGTAWEADTQSPMPGQLALARVRRGRTVGFLTDAYTLPGLPYGLLDLLGRHATVDTPDGELRFEPTAKLDELTLGERPEIRWLAAEQSNSSLIIGEEAVLKMVRRVVPGIHPEAEMTRYLTRLNYPNTAPLIGEVTRFKDGIPHTLVILQGFVENQGDAWNWSLDYLRRVIDDLAVAVDASTDAPVGEHLDESIAGYQSLTGIIGKRLGELHVALATPTDDPAFAPEPATPRDVRTWVDQTQALLTRALDTLAERLDAMNPGDRDRTETLLERRAALVEALERLVPDDVEALRTRIHGDFHLGQVLVAQGDAFLIDFEGEPARTVDERRAKTSPLRDVAGLLRSLSYVSFAAQPSTETLPAPTADRKSALFERFREIGEASFLAGYRAAIAQSPAPLAAAAAEHALLDLFLIEKAAYEICYEAANRPGWLTLPARGLASLADRLLSTGDRQAEKEDAQHADKQATPQRDNLDALSVRTAIPHGDAQ
jgi:maltose alpha-D-glucosyltransferase/alpha-amylase